MSMFIQPSADGVGASFVAAFESSCDICGCQIFEGDQAGYVDDEPVCGSCYDDARAGII